jgi:hypothetical protein
MRIQSTVGGAALALATVIAPSAPPQAFTGASVPREIQTILRAHCTICHSPGGPSPMSLVTDEDVLPWAAQIKDQALTRRMPVWQAARGYGSFRNDPTLTPYELEMVVRWADGAPPQDRRRTEGAAPASSAGAEATGTERAITLRVPSGWATGWRFAPGDPRITSATFTGDDGSTIGVWTAGDRAVRLPPGAAIRVISPVRVDIRRRQQTSYERAVAARRPSLQFSWLPSTHDQTPPTPTRRIRILRVACGSTIGPADATLIGVRPLLAPGASAQVTVERIGGAQPALIGWFRDFDPHYTRIYWLERPLDFVANARLTSDAPCDLDLVLSSRR